MGRDQRRNWNFSTKEPDNSKDFPGDLKKIGGFRENLKKYKNSEVLQKFEEILRKSSEIKNCVSNYSFV